MVKKLAIFFCAGVFLRWVSIGFPNWADFNVYWCEADGIWFKALLGLMREQNWIPFTGIHSARLGYPYGMDYGMYPVTDVLHWSFMHLINLMVDSPVLTHNLYFMIGAGFISAAMGFLCLSLGMSMPVALTAALAYSALPYAFARIQHLYLVTYFQVPLIYFLVLHLKEKLNPWMLVAFGAITAGTGIYYDLYSMLLLAVIGLITLLWQLKKKDYKTFKTVFMNGTYFGISCIVVTLMSMGSSWYYSYKHGDPKTHDRHYTDSIVFAMDTKNIFVPPTDHWFPPYREIKPMVYSPEELAADHMIGAYGGYMGLPAIFGFLLSLFVLFSCLRRKPTQRESWMIILAIGALFFMAFGQRYGLGYLFAYYVSPQIRSNYRVAIYVTTATLLAFYIWVAPRLEKIKDIKWKWAACAGLLLFSLLDQGGLFYPLNPDHKNTNSDRQFAKEMKAALGDKPMLKLPFGAFPEWSGYMSVEIYSTMRFTMAEKIHSVFPSIKGTKNLEEQWPMFFGKIPSKPSLLAYGIAGVVIDTTDYPDGGQAAMQAYIGPNTKKFYSPNQRFVFIDLRD